MNSSFVVLTLFVEMFSFCGVSVREFLCVRDVLQEQARLQPGPRTVRWLILWGE